jgi:hypothetical protein
MAEDRRELAKYEQRAAGIPAPPPLEIPQPEPQPPAPLEPEESAFAARGRVRWTPRRVRRMVPSKLKEVVVAILGALEDPPRRGAGRRRRLPGPDRWPPQAPAHALPASGGNAGGSDADNAPPAAPASESVGGAAREGAD